MISFLFFFFFFFANRGTVHAGLRPDLWFFILRLPICCHSFDLSFRPTRHTGTGKLLLHALVVSFRQPDNLKQGGCAVVAGSEIITGPTITLLFFHNLFFIFIYCLIVSSPAPVADVFAAKEKSEERPDWAGLGQTYIHTQIEDVCCCRDCDTGKQFSATPLHDRLGPLTLDSFPPLASSLQRAADRDHHPC